MRTVVWQWTSKLISPSLTTLLCTNLTELGNVWSHVTHIVEGVTNHVRNVCQRTFASCIVEALHTDITVNHRHVTHTHTHHAHAATLLTCTVYLAIYGWKSKNCLSGCLTHLLQVSHTCPVEHLLGVIGGIFNGTTAVTATHHATTVRIRNAKSLGTHDDCLVEQTTSQWRFTKGAHTATTCTLTENSHVVGVTTKLSDVLLNPLQCLNLVEDTVVTRYLVGAFLCKGWVSEESEDAKTVVDGNKDDILCAPLLSVKFWF